MEQIEIENILAANGELRYYWNYTATIEVRQQIGDIKTMKELGFGLVQHPFVTSTCENEETDNYLLSRIMDAFFKYIGEIQYSDYVHSTDGEKCLNIT